MVPFYKRKFCDDHIILSVRGEIIIKKVFHLYFAYAFKNSNENTYKLVMKLSFLFFFNVHCFSCKTSLDYGI